MDDFENFRVALESMIHAHFNAHYPRNTKPAVKLERGPKFTRIVTDDGVGRSAYGFIDNATGALLKADGWKRPAKGARGNVLGAEPLAGCTPHGVVYAYR